MVVIRTQVILFAAAPQTEAPYRANLAVRFRESSQTNFASHIYQAIVHLAQAKLLICRALSTEPGMCNKTRRLLEMLAAILQAAIESAQKLVVPE